ncbi:helix-turn-helix domain-containing protein [Kitasatospora sp. NPDC088346]|uniref:helix-turn-helix domain-containing protein n=1 Tax=Kitasatospora sp. NPDC088346 TaxID=3364073 RepID=UPI00382B0781
MAQELYSVEQVAELLGLHVRTVRGYVRDGRLKAVRIGKQYRIAGEDLAALTGRPVAEPSSAVPPSAPVARHGEATCVVRIDGIDRATVDRVTTLITAALTGRPQGGEPLRVETAHDRERASLKIIVIGGLEDGAEILRLVAGLTGTG